MSFSNLESSVGNRDSGEQIKSGRHPGPGATVLALLGLRAFLGYEPF